MYSEPKETVDALTKVNRPHLYEIIKFPQIT